MKLCGESIRVREKVCGDFLNALDPIFKDYESKNVFNALRDGAIC